MLVLKITKDTQILIPNFFVQFQIKFQVNFYIYSKHFNYLILLQWPNMSRLHNLRASSTSFIEPIKKHEY